MNKVAETIRKQTDFLSNDYTVKNGIIHSPGSFESNHISSLYFHDCVMNGGGNETFFDSADTQYDVFIITDSERQAFDFDSDDYAAVYYVDDSGFVYCPIVTREDYNRFLNDIEAE